MPLSVKAIQTILDIQGDLKLTETEMAKNLAITFFSHINKNIKKCSKCGHLMSLDRIFEYAKLGYKAIE